MTHVVTENCIKCKHTDCVDVCPVDCFRETQYMLVIDPDECIDCAVCIPECPSNAIFAEEDVPIGQEQFIEFNRIMTPEGSSITRSKKPFPDADSWDQVTGKAIFLELELPNLHTNPLYEHLLRASKLTDGEWAENLNSPDPIVRYILASRKDFLPDPDRLHHGLRDDDVRVRHLYAGLCANRLSDLDVDMLLNDPEKSIRMTILNQSAINLSDNQFFKLIDSGDRDVVCATLNKITADRALRALEHPSALVRSSAYGCESAHLSVDQIEKGLNDSESQVRYATIYRADFSPSPRQFVSLLKSENVGIRIEELCRKASAECITTALNEENPKVSSSLISYASTSVSADQKVKMLSMDDEQLSLEILNNFGNKIPIQAIEIALHSQSEEVRQKVIELCGVKALTEQQIAQCLVDSSDYIRLIVVRSAPMNAKQIESACTDDSKQVRLALVRRKDFTPSPKQLRRGLKDKCDEVREGFACRFQICEGKVVPLAVRGISRVLDDLAGIPTWTKEKYQLESELLSLIGEQGYLQFAVHSRRAWFKPFGKHGIIDVPINQRGSLKDMRGKKIHLICIGGGNNSEIYFAAKPIDQIDSKATVSR